MPIAAAKDVPPLALYSEAAKTVNVPAALAQGPAELAPTGMTYMQLCKSERTVWARLVRFPTIKAPFCSDFVPLLKGPRSLAGLAFPARRVKEIVTVCYQFCVNGLEPSGTFQRFGEFPGLVNQRQYV